jgi:hypothetical protein
MSFRNSVRFLNDCGLPGMQLVCLTRLLVSTPPTALLAAANTPCGRLGGICMLYLPRRGPGGGRHPPRTLQPPHVLPTVHMELAGEWQHVSALSH